MSLVPSPSSVGALRRSPSPSASPTNTFRSVSSRAHSSRSSPTAGGVSSLDGESYASCLVLDLSDQAYNDLHILNSKFAAKQQAEAYPWQVMILSGNMLSRLDGLNRCIYLRKLDLSRNGIDTLPKLNFWKQLRHLQVLFLHQNKIDSIHALQQLSCLPNLEILTCFGNAVEHHPAYRHVLVNVNTKLILLDFYIVSDAELIEGANWGAGNKFATYANTLECDILNMNQTFDGSEKSHLQILEAQLEVVRKQHRRFSPVLKIQSLFRGVLVRRTIKVYHQAASAIQNCFRRFRARKLLAQQSKKDSTAAITQPFASDKPVAPNTLTSLAAHTIFIVRTSDVAISLFMQLVRRVEQAEGVVAPELTEANMLLLSAANIKDDYPLVRRIFADRPDSVKVGCKVVPGKHCSNKIRRSLSILHNRCAGAIMNEHERFLLSTRITQHTYPNRFLQFQSPGSRFHELLIRAVHAYNIEMGNYNDEGAFDAEPPSLDPTTTDQLERAAFQQELQLGGQSVSSVNQNKVIIYPGTTVSVIAAAVSIQSLWRAYRTRKWCDPPIGVRVAQKRAVTAIIRWWRACLFRLRMHLLSGLKRYGDSINSRHLFCRGDIIFLIRSSPNAFVDKEFMPEHKSIFGIEPKEDLAYLNRLNQRGLDAAAAAAAEGEPLGKVTLVVDGKTGKRFYPYPRWLANHWNHQPLAVVHGFTDTGIRVDLSSRMTELIKEGVHISVLPDVSQPATLDKQLTNSDGWAASNFIKLSFASVEEARNRALILAINTWLPRFHLLRPAKLAAIGPLTANTPASLLAGSEMAFLMTPQHMTLCLQYQQAGGPSGPAGERHILYTTFWTKSRTAPSSLYSNQAYLDLQFQLKLVEETHIAAEKMEQRDVQQAALAAKQAALEKQQQQLRDKHSSHSEELEITGDPGISTYNPSIFALKREAAESERLLSRRQVAQARIKIHTEKLISQEHAREQVVMHRIKMEHLAEREIEARRQRQLDYERMDSAARAARDLLLSQKHARVHQFKHDLAQRAKLRELDRELDTKDLRKRVLNEKQVVAKQLLERAEQENGKVAEKVELKRNDRSRHARLLEEKDNTLSFISQQNMISRQLTVGMRNRLKLHQQQQVAATVAARRELAHQRRHQVHQILFENFNRRRQTALAQQLELKNHVQMRAVKDENKVNLLRARRLHLQSVRSLASSAAIATLNANSLNTQEELQAALATSSAHFTPFVQAPFSPARPLTSPALNPSHAYRPGSSARHAATLHVPASTAVNGTSLPPISNRDQSPQNALQTMAGDQLTLQMNVLRDLADSVALQFQTISAARKKKSNEN